MYVYWLKIIKYCCIYIDIDKEHYVLKLAKCLDYWFFDLVVTKTRALLFFSFLVFYFFFFPFFPFFIIFVVVVVVLSFPFLTERRNCLFVHERALKSIGLIQDAQQFPHSTDTRLTDLSTFFFCCCCCFFVFFNFWHKRVRKNPSTPQQRKRLNK